MANLLFVYGPPGVGKLTVAKELVKLLPNYHLFHNHLTFDLSFDTFGKENKDARTELSDAVRQLVFEKAVKFNINLIFTFVYGHGLDEPFIEKVVKTYNEGGNVYFVNLTANLQEIEKRVTNESRKTFRKETTVEGLIQMTQKYELFKEIPNSNSLIIDNSNKDSISVANEIMQHFLL